MTRLRGKDWKKHEMRNFFVLDSLTSRAILLDGGVSDIDTFYALSTYCGPGRLGSAIWYFGL